MHYGSAPYVFRGWVSVWRSGLSYACDLKPPLAGTVRLGRKKS